MQKRIRIDTANLEPGMFVAQLDRSWLETPFIKRGFEVTGDDELGLLRKFCEHVYVDVARSSLPQKVIVQAHENSGDLQDPFSLTQIRSKNEYSARGLKRVFGFFRRWSEQRRSPGKTERGQATTVRNEAPLAMAAYASVTTVMRKVLKNAKHGRAPNIDAIRIVVTPLVDSVLRNPDAMSWIGFMRKRDEGANSYSLTPAIWALIMGRAIGFDTQRLSNLAIGALLLDIGNTRIPASIGRKEGELTEDEFEIIRMHVDHGMDIAGKSSGMANEIVEMIRFHHERLDGSGYPNGVAGEDIPVFGRIAGIVDCFDAMISQRPYSRQMSAYDAVRELNQLAGISFQHEVIEQFIRAIGMFPTGSLVELNNGQVALVIEQSPQRNLRPKIMPVLSADRQPLANKKSIDLSRVPDQAGNKKALWIVGGFEAGSFDIDPQDYFLGKRG